MKEELEICEIGGLSEKNMSRLLRCPNVNAKYSRERMINILMKRTNVKKRYGFMCPDDHSAVYGEVEEDHDCPSSSCSKKVSFFNKYWYRLISEMISALCKEKESFQELLNGCINISCLLYTSDAADD